MTGILPRGRIVVVAFPFVVAGCSGAESGVMGFGQDDSGSGASSGSSGGSSGGAGANMGSSGSTAASGPTPASGSSSGSGSGSGGMNTSGGGGTSGNLPADAGQPALPIRPDGSVTDASPVEAGGSDAGNSVAAARAQCVQIINQYRATLSPPSPAVQEDTAEESCVDGQAQADYQANTAHSAFGMCKERAQDECPGWAGPPSAIMTKCLAQMWAEGPPAAGQDNHWLNMSNAKYTKVACGFYQTPSGKWWATQDFY
jgi:hypothetical protein